jgi:hypothetical protein
MRVRDYIMNGTGCILLFSMSLGMAWLTVRFLQLTWATALLVQILWLTVLNRWHQPSLRLASEPEGKP